MQAIQGIDYIIKYKESTQKNAMCEQYHRISMYSKKSMDMNIVNDRMYLNKNI